jgi:hypothetical protein
MLGKISDSFETQNANERWSGDEMLPFSLEALPDMSLLFERFLVDAVALARKYPDKTDLYYLSLHFINATPKKMKGRK